jgi:TrwC relaxase
VHDRETGQWHEADLAVAHWLQHTSRDGDMQLHVHSQIAHVARTGIDGKWRAPDSLGYNEYIGAVAAIVSQHLEEALTARFGLAWEARDDGHGFEIKGITGGDDAAVLLTPGRDGGLTDGLRRDGDDRDVAVPGGYADRGNGFLRDPRRAASRALIWRK